jgi:multicomponent K+:H+ antiporter subunit E
MILRFPLMFVALVALWLALNDSVSVTHVVLGAAFALIGIAGLARLVPQSTRLHRPSAALRLAGVVLVDIVRSNVEVAAIVLFRNRRDRRSGFVRIPLDLRHPAALATLACIITSTPGTSWAGYDSRSGVLTMHILDLVDEATWVDTIKSRYERPLLEIFE